MKKIRWLLIGLSVVLGMYFCFYGGFIAGGGG